MISSSSRTSQPQSAAVSPYADDGARWEAVKARDEAADGHFWFSVATTGVYCYPSCSARRPRRENVVFYATREAVERAGFRPCKRCRPDEPPRRVRLAEAVEKACRMIEQSETPPALAELANAAGLSPHYFHRCFKAIAGVTPKQYATAHRTQRVRRGLRNGGSVTDAVYGAGFGSSGRFYETSKKMLGMNPRAFSKGAPGEVIRWKIEDSSVGRVLVAATARGICATMLGDKDTQLYDELTARFPLATLEEAEPNSEFSAWLTRALELIEKPGGKGTLPLDVVGTAFQQHVWAALREIPAGQTSTYRDLAKRIGNPRAIRAVASACAANPVAVIIPCHRVLGSDGSLRGYRWGKKRKQALLEKEKAL
jgi:AraC family transcriptional regulator of adaptative response/methylated-DNA-[protein]-cysteine methyltransferase